MIHLPKTFHDQEAGMIDSWGNLKVSGDFHPKRRQVCSLRQKEAEVKLISTKYIDTSAKLQDLLPVLDDGTLLAELDNITTNLNVSLVRYEMRDKAGVDAATLAKTWGIGIEAAKRTRLVTTQRGMIQPSLTKRYNTNDRHYDTAACQSQCSRSQYTQQLSQGKRTRQLRHFELILVL
jgi:hypothetical protein